MNQQEYAPYKYVPIWDRFKLHREYHKWKMIPLCGACRHDLLHAKPSALLPGCMTCVNDTFGGNREPIPGHGYMLRRTVHRCGYCHNYGIWRIHITVLLALKLRGKQ